MTWFDQKLTLKKMLSDVPVEYRYTKPLKHDCFHRSQNKNHTIQSPYVNVGS